MNRLNQWIQAGKIMQFVAGTLSPTEHEEIFNVAKNDDEVRKALIAAKNQMMTQLISMAKQVDPAHLIASGKLEAYNRGTLELHERQEIEIMAMAHPQVSIAMEEIKRGMLASLIERAKEIDPQELIASTQLYDYVLGECNADEQREVEMAAAYFPEVAQELNALRDLDAALVMDAATPAPMACKARFENFMDIADMPADGWSLVMPMLGPHSKPADFASWLDQVDPATIDPSLNLNAIPLEADEDKLTLFVVVRDGLEEETHLFDIERFLVLEGSCYVEMEDGKRYLQAGDYFSVPKFKTHTVVVTSEIPCKLIVQQVAA